MKNNVSKVLIGIALMFAAGVAHSEPVEHTFSTTGGIFVDPLLVGLTSVTGSQSMRPPLTTSLLGGYT